MSLNLNFIKKLLTPLALKGLGMIISFSSIFVIINRFGLEMFGQYAQSVSFLLFLSGIAAYGYPQSFFRDSALMNFFQKKKLFNQMLLITFYISILIVPILALYFYFIEKLNLYQILITITIFLIMASSRLRFALLRTTKHVRFGEIPEQIVKPLVLVVFVLILPQDNIGSLYTALCLGLLSALLVNIMFLKNYYRLPTSFLVNRNLITINIKNTNTQLWISNALVLFKDFFELFIIGLLFGDFVSGEYKLVLQIYVVSMSVFNTMALINSHIFAKLIASGNYREVNKKALSEMAPSMILLTFLILSIISVEILFQVTKQLQMSEIAVFAIIAFMVFSFVNIAFGPVSQLLVHSRQIKKLIAMTIIRIFSVFFSAVLANLIGYYELFFFALFIVFIDIFVLMFGAKSLNNKIEYITPIFQQLTKRTQR